MDYQFDSHGLMPFTENSEYYFDNNYNGLSIYKSNSRELWKNVSLPTSGSLRSTITPDGRYYATISIEDIITVYSIENEETVIQITPENLGSSGK
ncbi:MAG: hypothetical protein K8F52_06015 [Candidatus Scalindua rubra]|nr:hypothetical protein [Candidatus Scalindua rubra]